MRRPYHFLIGLVLALVLPSCSSHAPSAPTALPGREVRRIMAQRLTAVVISAKPEINPWIEGSFKPEEGPKDADGGSAIPITSDGYFITADHVLAQSPGRYVHLIHGQSGRLRSARARIVWRSASTDLALLHAPIATPHYYQWTPPDQWLPEGTPVVHSGIATGFKSPPGKMITGFAPGTAGQFKHDIPLQPGDSGGAVVDARGLLVGVNSAVEFLVPLETAFFIESEANRPHLGHLQRIIDRDRRKNPATTAVR